MEASSRLQTVDIQVISLLVHHWPVVLTVAIAAVIVMVMKGPADAADAYPVEDAETPEFGDPPNFVFRDCSRQRNLDANGRAQARRLRARLRAVGVTNASVFSSGWCRARNRPPTEPWASAVPAVAEFPFSTGRTIGNAFWTACGSFSPSCPSAARR